MATRVWQGGAAAVAQVNTLTPTASNSQTYTITINGKSVTYTADASATVAEITAGLVAAVQASTEPEFLEVTAADGTTVLTLTAKTAGVPFTQTSAASGGGALVTSTTTASSGPNYWSVAANWSGSTVPVSTDDVIIDNSDVDILYGIDQNAVTLTSLTIGQGFTGAIGLPERNEAGYAEYRDTYLKISATTVTIGSSDSGASGSDRIKLNVGTVATTVTVFSTGQSEEANVESVLFKGTNAANVVNVLGGSVGIAVLPNEAATVATLRVGGAGDGGRTPDVNVGPTVTLTTVTQAGGRMTLGSGATTITIIGGEMTVTAPGGATTFNARGGRTTWMGGNITTLNVGGGAIIDFGQDPRAHTIGTATLEAGSTLLDPTRSITFTNLDLSNCDLSDITKISLGKHIRLTVAAGP